MKFLEPFRGVRGHKGIGEKKAHARVSKLLIYGILAGICIAFGSNVATAVLSGGALDGRRLCQISCRPGLWAEGKFMPGLSGMFNNLISVTIGNIIGGFLIALLHPKPEEK
jgi:formate/nitrite transporter FocA (FNT family)